MPRDSSHGIHLIAHGSRAVDVETCVVEFRAEHNQTLQGSHPLVKTGAKGDEILGL